MTLPRLHPALPQQLERFLPARARGLAFGIPALDALLPGGLPRGRITSLEAPLGSGGTALLLALAGTTLRADDGVAFVDAARTLAPQAAAHLADLGRFWVVRPRGTESAWWCADVLLRTGAFGLVVVDQAPAPHRNVAVRLQRIAADKDSALVVRGRDLRAVQAAADEGGALSRRPARTFSGRAEVSTHRAEPGAAGDVRAQGRREPGPTSARPPLAALILGVEPAEDGFVPAVPGAGFAWPGPRTVRVTIEKGGAPRAAEVRVGIGLPDRLRPHWAVPDRRPGRSAGGTGGRTQRRRAAQPAWPEPR